MKKYTAFTLVELAVVVLVVSLLLGVIMQSSGLVKSARIANARSITSKSTVPAISGLIAWYETSAKDSFKAAEANENAQTTEWRDISPSSISSGKNILTKTASAGVIYTIIEGINQVPSLKFNGSSNITLASFYQGTSSQNTIFIVARPLVVGAPSTILDSDTSGTTTSVGIGSNYVNLNAGSSVNTGTTTNAASFISSNDYIIAAYFNGSSSRAFVNNTTTSAGAATINPSTNQLKGLTIGTNKSSSGGFNGLISEIIIYDRLLKDQERRDVMAYLSKKYKILVTGL